jgi:tRNA A-37 threonylcarbamoyl transferase component Bud32
LGFEIRNAWQMLATDSQHRQVVLKPLPPDCLLEGQLNPNVAERLRRVREIAMTNVPTLIGVERRDDGTYLVWQHIDGVPFEIAATDCKINSDQAIALVREMLHTAERFHATGLVHGALHSGNVLVRDGRIYLIDVSPLLYLDPKRDEQAVMQMVQRVVDAREESDSALGNALKAALRRPSPMQELAAQLSAHAAGETLRSTAPPRPQIRRRTLLAALLTLVVGIGFAVAIARAVYRNRPTFTPPPLAPVK